MNGNKMLKIEEKIEKTLEKLQKKENIKITGIIYTTIGNRPVIKILYEDVE